MKAKAPNEQTQLLIRRVAEAVFLILVVLAFYLMLALLTHSPNDPGFMQSSGDGSVRNLGGPWGAWIADLFLVLFGYMAYASPVALGVGSLRVLKERSAPATLLEWGVRSGGLVLVISVGAFCFICKMGVH